MSTKHTKQALAKNAIDNFVRILPIKNWYIHVLVNQWFTEYRTTSVFCLEKK